AERRYQPQPHPPDHRRQPAARPARCHHRRQRALLGLTLQSGCFTEVRSLVCPIKNSQKSENGFGMRPPSVARLQFLDLTQEGNICLMKARRGTPQLKREPSPVTRFG